MSDHGMIEPRDRKEFAKEQPLKLDKFPRTDRRQTRLRQVLERRQPGLTVVLEDIHDVHNASAVLRTADATGVLTVHLVYSYETPPERAFSRVAGAGASKWIEIIWHDTIEDCYAALHAEGYAIYVTALHAESVSLYDVDYTGKVALVFGNEQKGVSEAAIAGADGVIIIPMVGVVESLNISVACSVTLYEAMRQRLAAGCYAAPSLEPEALNVLYEDWLTR
jgi:tRNA (guanosine-2'-O-)-methyltransferase